MVTDIETVGVGKLQVSQHPADALNVAEIVADVFTVNCPAAVGISPEKKALPSEILFTFICIEPTTTLTLSTLTVHVGPPVYE